MIVLDKENKVFTLHTRRTTYQMKADGYGVDRKSTRLNSSH